MSLNCGLPKSLATCETQGWKPNPRLVIPTDYIGGRSQSKPRFSPRLFPPRIFPGRLYAAVILLWVVLPCSGQELINSWHSGTPQMVITTGSPNHINFVLWMGAPRYEAPHGLNFDNPEAVTKFPCASCWMIGENKHGELWFAIWKSPCPVIGQCSFVGRFVDDALLEDDELTGESLLIRRFHGTLLGTWYINGKSCPGTQAFFTDKTNATPANVSSGGIGDLDVRIWNGALCQ